MRTAAFPAYARLRAHACYASPASICAEHESVMMNGMCCFQIRCNLCKYINRFYKVKYILNKEIKKNTKITYITSKHP